MRFAENATAEFLKPKGVREGPCADLVECSAASKEIYALNNSVADAI